jgi:enoyl-CoA hydratase
MSFSVGQKATYKKSFSKEEVSFYCQKLSIDNNPIHYDREFAAKTKFGRCIVPGIMVTSLFGGLLGSTLPGNGTIHLGQTSNFVAPVFIDEEVEAIIEIIAIRADKPIITFSTKVFKPDGQLAIDGQAVVKVDSRDIG